MSNELNFVADLAVILISAGIFTIISKALKQPLILGYIIAGFLVGPQLGLFPSLSSMESVEQWSEIGMIFLMFALGLEFSFKGLLKVGSSALITATCKFLGMFAVGMIAGPMMGWTLMESIFLGGLLSMASTTIVIKAYDEMGLKQKPYAPMVFGTLVVEDIIAILLMVLLSTIAVSNSFAGMDMVMNIAKMAFFIILWFLVGIYVIPTLLKKAGRYINDEILLIVSIGLCFGMVTLASSLGFSSALGAFVMGSILAETTEGEHISGLVTNIKNLFGAIFFVSVGMMIDPHMIAQHWFVILVLTLIVIAGHFFFAAAGVILNGKGLDNAVHVGLSLSQLGEFAFIIVSLGTSLGVMRGFIYPVIIAVSVITTFTTPYMIRLAGPATVWFSEKLPAGFLARITPEEDTDQASSRAESNAWKLLLKAYFTRVLLYSVMLVAVFLGSELWLKPLIARLLPSWGQYWQAMLCVMITLSAMMPFLFGLAVNPGSISKPAQQLTRQKASNWWPILSLLLIRIAIAVCFIISVLMAYLNLASGIISIIVIGAVIFFFFARMGKKHFRGFMFLEKHFLTNLNEKEAEERRLTPVRTTVQDKLSGYDVHIETVEISPDSIYAGMMLQEIPFRRETGINIVKIVRGKRGIIVPKGTERIFPHDRVLAVGTTEQLARFTEMMRNDSHTAEDSDQEFTVMPVTVDESSPLCGTALRNIDMRAYGCMVISILRDGKFITNPKADFVFETGDTVWLAGETAGCNSFK